MTGHTPGPWDAETPPNGAIHVSAVAAPRGDICDLYHVGMPTCAGASGEIFTKDNAEANALLIAAAPDLLWFASQILESGDLVEVTSPVDEALAVIIAKGRAAIAKAKGETS